MKVNLERVKQIFNGTSRLKSNEQLGLLLMYFMQVNEVVEKYKNELPKELTNIWDLKE